VFDCVPIRLKLFNETILNLKKKKLKICANIENSFEVRKQFGNIENTVTTRYHMLGCGGWFLEAIMVVEGVGK
jgi:hypothetical protein